MRTANEVSRHDEGVCLGGRATRGRDKRTEREREREKTHYHDIIREVYANLVHYVDTQKKKPRKYINIKFMVRY